MTQRLQKHPFLALFDGPDPNATTEKRGRSTVPTQSLYLMNSPELKNFASAFAGRLAPIADERERIDRAYRICFARAAREEEVDGGAAFLAAWRAEWKQTEGEGAPEQEAWASYLRVLLASNEFLYVD